MWKKFLAAATVIALLASSTAFAQEADENYKDYSVSTNNFDPVKGEKVTFGLTVLKDAYVTADVMKEGGVIPIYTFDKNVAVKAGAVLSYTWYGREENGINASVLEDAKYIPRIQMTVGSIPAVNLSGILVTLKSSVNTAGPVVSSLVTTPGSFSPKDYEDTQISFSVDKGANLTVTVSDSNDKVVKTFSSYNGGYHASTKTHSIRWDGKNDKGQIVSDGLYKVLVKAKNSVSENIFATTTVVATTKEVNDGVIKKLQLDQSGNWDPTDEEMEIDFELTSDVSKLSVEAVNGNKHVKILDEDDADSDDYTVVWDGTDDDGDYVKPGTWEIIVRANENMASKKINVGYSVPEVSKSYVTKASFDPYQDERTSLMFKLASAGVVTVEVYKGTKKEATLWDEVEVSSKNKWYTVEWDGRDKDFDEVAYGKDWKFKITAENSTENDVNSVSVVPFAVEEDSVTSKKINVTVDGVFPSVYDDGLYKDGVTFTYCLDAPADVFLAVYEGDKTSGTSIGELFNYYPHEAGCFKPTWDGKNSKGKVLKDGLYSYKLVSRSADKGSYKDTETGVFIIGNSGYFEVDDSDKVEPLKPAGSLSPVVEEPKVEEPKVEEPVDEEPVDVDPVYPRPSKDLVYGSCADYYWDTAYLAGNEMCDAIAWATENGIFSGYPNGSFDAFGNINRAEVLKVVLKAFNAKTLPVDGTNQGFSDVDPYAWYMPFVRTAKMYGMLSGYANGKVAGLEGPVNRAELLKFALEAGNMFSGYKMRDNYQGYYNSYADVDPYSWYSAYAAVSYDFGLFAPAFGYGSGTTLSPNQAATRGEVALLLFRMKVAGLL